MDLMVKIITKISDQTTLKSTEPTRVNLLL